MTDRCQKDKETGLEEARCFEAPLPKKKIKKSVLLRTNEETKNIVLVSQNNFKIALY